MVNVLQEGIIILNVYEQNHRVLMHLRQKQEDMKGETDKSSVIDEEFNIPLSLIDNILPKAITY